MTAFVTMCSCIPCESLLVRWSLLLAMTLLLPRLCPSGMCSVSSMFLVVSVTNKMPTLNLQSVERNSGGSVVVTLQFVVYSGGTSVAVIVMFETSAVGLRLCAPLRLFVKLLVSVTVRL